VKFKKGQQYTRIMCTVTLPLRPSLRPLVTSTKPLDQTALRVENDRPTGNHEQQGGV